MFEDASAATPWPVMVIPTRAFRWVQGNGMEELQVHQEDGELDEPNERVLKERRG